MGDKTAADCRGQFAPQEFMTRGDAIESAGARNPGSDGAKARNLECDVDEANDLVSMFLFRHGLMLPLPEGDPLFRPCKRLALLRYRRIASGEDAAAARRFGGRIRDMEYSIGGVIARTVGGCGPAAGE